MVGSLKHFKTTYTRYTWNKSESDVSGLGDRELSAGNVKRNFFDKVTIAVRIRRLSQVCGRFASRSGFLIIRIARTRIKSNCLIANEKAATYT